MPQGRNPIDAEIGRRIRQRRIDLRMSRDYLAERIGVTDLQVQLYEAGADRVPALDLMVICRTLDWRVSNVFDPPPPTAAGWPRRLN